MWKGGKSEIEKHSIYEKHKSSISAIKIQPSIASFISDSTTILDENTINATILTAAFAVEYNISFNATGHVPKLLPKQCSGSAIAENNFRSNKVYCCRKKYYWKSVS